MPYSITHNGEGDPTFGGTVPLKRLEVSTAPQSGDRREARLLHNGVPVSAHWFKVEAEQQALATAKAHGLDCYYVDGQRKAVS